MAANYRKRRERPTFVGERSAMRGQFRGISSVCL